MYLQLTPNKTFKKDEMTAMIFSAITTGLGQVYTQRYWRAAGFFVLEMAALGTFGALTEKQKKITIYDAGGHEYHITVKKNRWKNLNSMKKTAVVASAVSAVGRYIWQIVDARKCALEHNQTIHSEAGFGLLPDGKPGLGFTCRF